MHSLSGQASALFSSGMSAFSNLSSRGTTTSHNAYVLGGRGTNPLFRLHLQRGATIPRNTSGGRPLTEAMVSYPERARAV